jgi:hypothetical protein
MSKSNVQDFAERVKKFYVHQAFLCEQLLSKQVSITNPAPILPPNSYMPLSRADFDCV